MAYYTSIIDDQTRSLQREINRLNSQALDIIANPRRSTDMSLPKWLRILQTVGLAALAVSPLAPIATQVGAAIAEAEAIFLEEGSGPKKLEHVLTAAEKAAETAQALGVTISPQEVRAVGAEAISTAVDVTNLVAKAKKPKRQPEPQPETPDILPDRSDR